MPQIMSLFVREDSNIIFDGDLSKLNKYKFGVVRAFSYGKVFDTAVKDGVLTKIEKVNSVKQNIKKLLAGRFDILVSNKYGALDVLQQINKEAKKSGKRYRLKELATNLQNVPSYILFSKKNKLSAIRDKFDVILTQMKKDGSYDKIINSYFEQ